MQQYAFFVVGAGLALPYQAMILAADLFEDDYEDHRRPVLMLMVMFCLTEECWLEFSQHRVILRSVVECRSRSPQDGTRGGCLVTNGLKRHWSYHWPLTLRFFCPFNPAGNQAF